MTNEADTINAMKALAAFGPLMLNALAARALTFVAVLACIGLFIAAMAMGTTMSLWIAATFAVLVFLPALLKANWRV